MFNLFQINWLVEMPLNENLAEYYWNFNQLKIIYHYRKYFVAISRYKTKLIISGISKQILREKRDCENTKRIMSLSTSLVARILVSVDLCIMTRFCEVFLALTVECETLSTEKQQMTIFPLPDILFEGIGRFPHCW